MGTDADPVSEAIEQYGPLVMRIIWRIAREPEDVRDLFQETFLSLHNAIRHGEQITYIKAWVCRTALNLSLNWQRRQQQARVYADQHRWREPSASDSTAALEQHRLVEQVRALCVDLPERQRDVFVLRHFEGLSFTEISEILGCTPEAARANAYQALQKIRAWMQAWQDQPKRSEP